MTELWDNVENALSSIKYFVFGFYDITNAMFDLIPSPFSDILRIAVIIIIALIVIKVVRK